MPALSQKIPARKDVIWYTHIKSLISVGTNIAKIT